MFLFLQERDDTGLLKRGQFREDGCPDGGFALFLGAHCGKLGSTQRMGRVDTYLTGNSSDNSVVISRENLDFDAVLVQLANGFGGRGFGRIEKGEITDQDHFRLVGDTEIMSLVQVTFLGDGNDTHSLPVHLSADHKCLFS